MKIAIALIALVIGTIIFHFVSPWYFTPIASNWGSIDDTINITFLVTGIVFVAVNFFLAYVILRYRHNKNKRAHYEPENKKLEIGLILITTVGIVSMLAPGLFVWAKLIDVPDDAHFVEAVGQQWQWSFRYPGKDGVMGKVSTGLVSPSNPFGIDPKDNFGQDDILINRNEAHLPLGKSVKFLLRSKDVLHNFTVPQFRVKMDLVPGMVTFFWFKPIRKGRFEILCEELCGLAHFAMRGHVVVDSEQDFDTWLNSQPTFSQTQIFSSGNPDKGQPLYAVCSACHGQQGEGSLAMNAPSLSGMPDWYLIRQLEYYKKGIRGAHKDDILGRQMAAMAATLVDDSAVRDVVAYIATLRTTVNVNTIEGDVSRGYSYFVTCGTCHGKNGEGKQGLNAPTLAGQHDWYLKRQLQNYKQGIRGKHQNDLFGMQMRLMAKVLKDEQAIDDLVAYINMIESP